MICSKSPIERAKNFYCLEYQDWFSCKKIIAVSVLLRLSGRVIFYGLRFYLLSIKKKIIWTNFARLCIYISPTEYTRGGICLPVILNRNLLSTCEYTHARSRRRRRSSDLLTFLTSRDWGWVTYVASHWPLPV